MKKQKERQKKKKMCGCVQAWVIACQLKGAQNKSSERMGKKETKPKKYSRQWGDEVRREARMDEGYVLNVKGIRRPSSVPDN